MELKIGRGRSAAAGGDFELIRTGEPKKISLRANDQALVPFVHRFTTPGTYAVQVSVDAAHDDRLDPDNSRTVIVTVREKIPLLLVNGQPRNPNKGQLDDAIGELPEALDPPPLSKDSARVPVTVTTQPGQRVRGPQKG